MKFPEIKLRWKLLLTAILWGWFYWMYKQAKGLDNPPSTLLPKNDIVRITVDPDKHHLRIEQPNRKLVDTFLPDRASTFEVKTDGTLKVTSSQFGFERHFFLGVFGSEFLRFGGGLDFFYWKRIDVGIGAAINTTLNHPIAFGKIGYVIYDNVSLGIMYDSTQHVGAALTIRI